jgi:hypothetical protein
MDEETIQLLVTSIVTIVAAIMTFLTAWLSTKKTEAYDQGDLLIKSAQDQLKIADALVGAIPELAPAVAKLRDALTQFQAGWEDKNFTTLQMIALKGDIVGFIADIAAVIKAKFPPKAV